MRVVVPAVATGLLLSTSYSWVQAKAAVNDPLPNGLLVFVAPWRGRDPGSEYSRAIVSLTTPALVTKILRKAGAGFVTMGSVSPGGRKIAFYWNSPDTILFGDPADLRVLDTSTGTEITLLRGSPAQTLWSPDGSILCMDSPISGDEKLFIDLENNRMWRWKAKLPATLVSSRGVAISLADAQFTTRGIVAAVYSEETRRQAYVLFHWINPSEVIAPKISGLRLSSLSPDFSTAADLDRAGTLTLRPSEGGEPTWFNLRMRLFEYPAWSPDGAWVALKADSKIAAKFIAVNVHTGRTVNLKGIPPISPGAKWISLQPPRDATVLASVKAALGPGEPLALPIDCQREAQPTEDWSNYKPIGACPLSLQPAAKHSHE